MTLAFSQLLSCRLQVLTLCSCAIRQLPAALGSLPELTHFHCFKNDKVGRSYIAMLLLFAC